MVPGDRRPSGLIVHRHGPLDPELDLTVQLGLRVTSPALTALDLAAELSDRRLARVIDDLRMPHPYVTLDQLADIADRMPRHRGRRRLVRVLGEAEAEPTRSPWEQDWRPFARRYGLPPHELNTFVDERRVDALFPFHGVTVELDGWDTHRT